MNEAPSFLSMMSLGTSDLLALSFDLRERGVPADDAVGLVGTLVTEFAMWRCAFLATAVARKVGREHLVSFHSRRDGRLLHAVVAASPQHGSPLRGYGLDVLGRRRLSDIEAEVARLSGPVAATIGDMIDAGSLPEAEAAALVDLARHLPWFRPLVGSADDPGTIWRCVSAALAMGQGHPVPAPSFG